jgi:malonate transporter and related proteins
MQTVALLLPELAMIALGYVLCRYLDWGRAFWDGLERLVYFVLFPALLFLSIARAPLSLKQSAPALLTVLLVLAAGISLAWLARPMLRADARQWASGMQCAFRFNSYIALALAQRLGGEQGLALTAVIIGVSVPIVNAVSVYALASQSGTRWWQEAMRNPLIIATVLGLIGNALQVPLPDVVAATINRLGSAALAVGLLTVGAGLVLAGSVPASTPVRGSRGLMIWFTATKLLALPAVAWLCLSWFGIQGLVKQIVIMFAAAPTSSSTYILASRMGGDGPFVARLITVSTVLSMLTLPLWLGLSY